MPTWVDAYNQMRSAMERTNQASPQGYPRVTNEQAASILRATMTAATQHKLPPEIVEQWYPVALALAGWRTPGDRFLVDAEHRRTMFPDAALPVLWTLALNVATNAQDRGVAFTAPTVNPQLDYTAVLKQAWSKMQRDAKATAQPAPAPATMPTLPGPAPAEGAPWGLLALAYFGAKALSKQRRGR